MFACKFQHWITVVFHAGLLPFGKFSLLFVGVLTVCCVTNVICWLISMFVFFLSFFFFRKESVHSHEFSQFSFKGKNPFALFFMFLFYSLISWKESIRPPPPKNSNNKQTNKHQQNMNLLHFNLKGNALFTLFTV